MSIHGLPKEVQRLICDEFNALAHVSMAETCKHWNGLCMEREKAVADLWKKFLADAFPTYQITANVPFKQQYRFQYEIQFVIDKYPSRLIAVFGGPIQFAKIPLRKDGEMTASMMRTFKYSLLSHRKHPGIDIRIMDKKTNKTGIVSLEESHTGRLTQHNEWRAYTSPELGIHFFAKNPPRHDFSCELTATSQRLQKMLTAQDDSFEVV